MTKAQAIAVLEEELQRARHGNTYQRTLAAALRFALAQLRGEREKKEMRRCESCLAPATQICGEENQPMLNFCNRHYTEHLIAAHGRSTSWDNIVQPLREEPSQ